MSLPSILVALETSGPVGSVALSADGVVLSRAFLGERGGHAAGLIPALDGVLQEAGVSRRAIGGIVVGGGPGSFTGVRVAAAAGKGLSHALRVPLWAVSSFLAAVLTEEALPGDAGPWGMEPDSVGQHLHTRYILFDARGDRVFGAAYRLTDGVPVELRAPRFAHLGEILDDSELAGAGFCGDGAARHAVTLRDAGRLVLPPPLGFPSADGLLRALAVSPRLPPLVDPFAWEPEYLRASNAERGRGA
ncbi:MAG TPA: tRNA (adenosine(37)-N6)-threonylcarbamoyltransferase complex dimerization subunit type 1 TsaB [Longimicrobiales bacterium]|nr:tRNA (adenosine(37)-N6)-threonylcarbamoyltransferase complex dimerization subunit type 1 TsaB [Longimicrobiales bacterium]